MAASRRAVGRHQLRTWLKWAIRSGLFEKLPSEYRPEGMAGLPPGPPLACAQRLLEALTEPEPAHRPLKEIIDEAQRFQDWVDFRLKMNRRLILTDGRTDGAEIAAMEREHASPADWEGPSRREPLSRPRARARSHPLWDEWLDGHRDEI